MTSAEHAALLRKPDRDRAGEHWEVTERELEEMAENYWYEEKTMRNPSAVATGLTEKEALWLYDYALDHTGYLPEKPEGYETKGRQLRYRFRVPGMPQTELRDLIERMRR